MHARMDAHLLVAKSSDLFSQSLGFSLSPFPYRFLCLQFLGVDGGGFVFVEFLWIVSRLQSGEISILCHCACLLKVLKLSLL